MKPSSSTSFKDSKTNDNDKAGTSTSADKSSDVQLKKIFPSKHKLSSITNAKERKKTKWGTLSTPDKTVFIKVVKELCHEGKTFLSDDPKIIDKAVVRIQEKLKNEKASYSDTNIKILLQHLIRIIDKQRFLHDEPIDKWLEQLRALTPPNHHLEQQLKSALTVAIEEPIPDLLKPKTNGKAERSIPEPNFGDVYKYLACAVADLPLPELSPVDSLLVEDCMQSLVEQIKSLDDSDLRLNLRKMYLYLSKVEGQGPEEDEENLMEQLANGDLFNPFGINQNLIVPVPPD